MWQSMPKAFDVLLDARNGKRSDGLESVLSCSLFAGGVRIASADFRAPHVETKPYYKSYSSEGKGTMRWWLADMYHRFGDYKGK